MQSALAVGDKYFGLQNKIYGNDRQCFTTNDLTSAQKYGVNQPWIALWSTSTQNTGSSNDMSLTNDGNIIIKNGTNIIYKSNNIVPACVNGGNISNVNASYGVNCDSSGYSVSSGNVTDKVNNIINNDPNKSSYTIPVSNSTFTDPAVRCYKTFSASYTCGNTNKTVGSGYGEGSYAQLDCSDEVSKCNFFLILQDDGNMCIYNGTPYNNGPTVWCAYTQGRQQSKNPDWVASKGKGGVSYITFPGGLNTGEWIGSNDGSLMLLMQTDGNLVLYTSNTTGTCPKDNTDGKNYGSTWANAIYSIDNIGNKDDLGKIGYIDYEGNLSEYPSSMSSVDANGNVTINNNSSCTKQVNPIDSVAWDSFKKNSYGMTPDTMCGLANELIEEDIIINSIKGRLSIVADQLIQKITDLKNQNTSLNGQIDLDRDALDKNIQAYQTISDKYSKFKKDGEKYKMNNILLDSDVTVTYENYNFILWLILAIVLLLILFYYMR
jgi:hypothetical protein